MHGTFKDIQNNTAFIERFNAFIESLYVNGVVPTVQVVDDMDNYALHYRRTGKIAVLSEDEEDTCAVFGNWGACYAFYGWANYRSLNATNAIPQMVKDILDHNEWSNEISHWISIVNGMLVVQQKYAAKFGHFPTDLNRFIADCVVLGDDFVLRDNVY
ncbi:hypothetical protein ACWX0O_01855 [Nitrobacteraceae bacterium UC4449_H16]